jgi:hypothetical protein
VKVAFYDRLSIDDMASYRELADIRVHSRFRPIRDYDYDLVLVTHTRIAGALRMPVVLVGTATEITTNLAALKYRGPSWATHAVAAHALRCLQAGMASPFRPISVVGRGPIAKLCARWARRYWPAGVTQNTMLAGGIILATPASSERYLFDDSLDVLSSTVLVSVARGEPVSERAVNRALDAGHLRAAYLDIAPRWASRPGVVLTGHRAWDGHRSAERRQRAIRHVLALANEGRLDELRRIDTTTADVGLWAEART